MGSMTDDEYTSRFLELLRYVPYLTEEKSKIHRFTSGLQVAFKDKIDSMSLDHWRRLRHCYEQSKHKNETKPYWRGNAKKKENGTEREQGLKIQVTRRMLHHLRRSIHMIEDRDSTQENKIRRQAGSLQSVGFVARIIAGGISCRIRVVDLRYTVRKRYRLFGMLVRVFHVSMKHWIKNRQIIRHLSLGWMLSFLIKLFLF